MRVVYSIVPEGSLPSAVAPSDLVISSASRAFFEKSVVAPSQQVAAELAEQKAAKAILIPKKSASRIAIARTRTNLSSVHGLGVNSELRKDMNLLAAEKKREALEKAERSKAALEKKDVSRLVAKQKAQEIVEMQMKGDVWSKSSVAKLQLSNKGFGGKDPKVKNKVGVINGIKELLDREALGVEMSKGGGDTAAQEDVDGSDGEE